MSQSISKIHPSQTLKTHLDGNVYYYNNDHKWVRSNIEIHKIYDKTVNDIKNMDVKLNDYIFLYKKTTNHIKFSEDYTRYIDSSIINNSSYTDEQKYYWVTKNMNISTDTSHIPDLSKGAQKINTVYKSGNESSISQICYTTNNEYLTFSVYLKRDDSIPTNYVALSLMSDTYNVGVSVKADLLTINESTQLTPIIMDNNYNTSSQDITNNKHILSSYSGGIDVSTLDDGSQCYRLYICCKFDAYQQTRCKLNILDRVGNYTYNLNSSIYKLYIGGFQLEKYIDTLHKPSNYIVTYNDKPNSMNSLDKTWVVIDENKNVQERTHKLFYSNILKETYDYDDNMFVATNIEPIIKNQSIGDIMVVTSILSFANKIEENKERVRRRNTNVDTKTKLLITTDDIPEEDVKRLTTDCAVQFGDSTNVNDPLYSIHYSNTDKNYKIKVSSTDYNVFKINKKTNNDKIIKAMTYNQGIFETWSEKGKCRYRHGFNTGGGKNFWK